LVYDRGELMKIATLCAPDMDHFLPGIEGVFRKAGHEVQRFVTAEKEEIEEAIDFAACGGVLWCEWANEAAALATHLLDERWSGRLVIRCHSYEAFGRGVGSVAWGNVNQLVVTSRHMLEILRRRVPALAGRREGVAVIPSGVDFEEWKHQPNHGTSMENHWNIGVVNYIHGRKNPFGWLLVLEALHKTSTRYTLHVAGEPQEAFWQYYFPHMIKQLNLTGAVKFYSHVPNEKLPEWWADKDWCLSASVHEGMPYNVVEAMALGVQPVVHNYLGASDQLPYGSLWSLPEEAAAIIRRGYARTDTTGAGSCLGIREYAKKLYSLQEQTPALLKAIGA
jgi:glycosyltransferase involved in cell wall biosynthesis